MFQFSYKLKVAERVKAKRERHPRVQPGARRTQRNQGWMHYLLLSLRPASGEAITGRRARRVPPAAVIQALIPCLTQMGMATVRMRRPLPSKSPRTQRPSLLLNGRDVELGQFVPPEWARSGLFGEVVNHADLLGYLFFIHPPFRRVSLSASALPSDASSP
jgi:hypothetical protein